MKTKVHLFVIRIYRQLITCYSCGLTSILTHPPFPHMVSFVLSRQSIYLLNKGSFTSLTNPILLHCISYYY